MISINKYLGKLDDGREISGLYLKYVKHKKKRKRRSKKYWKRKTRNKQHTMNINDMDVICYHKRKEIISINMKTNKIIDIRTDVILYQVISNHIIKKYFGEGYSVKKSGLYFNDIKSTLDIPIFNVNKDDQLSEIDYSRMTKIDKIIFWLRESNIRNEQINRIIEHFNMKPFNQDLLFEFVFNHILTKNNPCNCQNCIRFNEILRNMDIKRRIKSTIPEITLSKDHLDMLIAHFNGKDFDDDILLDFISVHIENDDPCMCPECLSFYIFMEQEEPKKCILCDKSLHRYEQMKTTLHKINTIFQDNKNIHVEGRGICCSCYRGIFKN